MDPAETGRTDALERDRLLRALLESGRRRGETPVLLGYDGPLAILELPDDGVGIVLLDSAAAPPDELRRRIDRILEAHRSGVLFVVLVGGGADARTALAAADREAPDPSRLGVYHVPEGGRLERVAGRRLALLETAGRALPGGGALAPFAPDEVAQLIERGRRERDEAVAFAESLRGRVPFATIALVAACVIVHALAAHWGKEAFPLALLLMGANSHTLVIEHHEIWRLLSYAFLHGGLGHLLVNMLALQSFGGFLEGTIGIHRYLLLYGLSALGGGVASVAFSTADLSVGASGAIWGLMAGGYALTRMRGSPLPGRIARGLRRRLFVVLALNALISLMPGIDLWAHLGGGVVGFVVAASGLLARRPDEAAAGQRASLVVTAGALIAILLAGSSLLAIVRGRAWDLDEVLRRRAGTTAIAPALGPLRFGGGGWFRPAGLGADVARPCGPRNAPGPPRGSLLPPERSGSHDQRQPQDQSYASSASGPVEASGLLVTP